MPDTRNVHSKEKRDQGNPLFWRCADPGRLDLSPDGIQNSALGIVTYSRRGLADSLRVIVG